MGEHRDHILIRLMQRLACFLKIMVLTNIVIEVVCLVALIENVSHHLRWRSIDNSRRYNVCHVSMISIFGYLEFWVREKLANSC